MSTRGHSFRGQNRAFALLLATVISPTVWAAPPGFTDGTIPTVNPSSFPDNLYAHGDSLYFVADDGIHGRELWMWKRDDGNSGAGRIALAVDIVPGQIGSSPERLTGVDDWIYLVAGTHEHPGRKIAWAWHREFSEAVRVRRLREGTYLFNAHFLGMTGGRLCLSAWQPPNVSSLFSVAPGSTGASQIAALPRVPGQSGEAVRSTRTAGGMLVCYAVDGVTAYDGTKRGWRRIWTFPDNSDLYVTGAIAAIGDQIVFVGFDEQHGRELWTTDGTKKGTRLLRDIAPGNASSGVGELVVHESAKYVYFSADDGDHGRELWKSDGTPENTVLVKDINQGRSHANPYCFVPVGECVFFLAQDDDHGKEVWRTDGTSEGTRIVADLFPGIQGSEPWRLTCFNDELFFCADSPTYGEEIFRVDETSRGVRVVRDIVPGLSNSGPHNLTVFEDLLFFTCDDGIHGEELWMTDGTSEGTVLAADVYPLRFNPPSSPRHLTAFNDRLLFVARDAAHGEELWMSDGTNTGTRLVRDIAPGQSNSSPQNLVPSAEGVFFSTDDTEHGRELWYTDGTSEGTRLVLDIKPGPDDAAIESATVAGNTAFFSANDGTHGQELWRSDGSPEGTVLLRDLTPGPDSTAFSQFVELDGEIHFCVEGAGKQVSIWASDGTPEGTRCVAEPEVAPLRSPLPPTERKPGPEQAFLVRLLYPHNGSPPESAPARLGSTTYFVARTPDHGTELWRSDGPPSSTHLVRDLFSGPSSSSPTHLTAANGELFFIAEHPGEGRVLWRTDGTADGTSMVTLTNEMGRSFRILASELCALGDTLVLCSLPSLDREAAPNDAELRIIQPDRMNVRAPDALETLRVGAEGSWPSRFTVAGAHVFFSADDGIHGEELWVTDGTSEGTRLVMDIAQPGDLAARIR
ncbi:MAG: hypothetical protein GY851_02595 [bacterium]|nr:hypothetical protein [bacterium]